MAQFITRKEKIRRIILLVLFILTDITLGSYAYYFWDLADKKQNGYIEGEEENAHEVEGIKHLLPKIRVHEDEYNEIEASIYRFILNVGWRIRAHGSADFKAHSLIQLREMQEHLDGWVKRLQTGYQTKNKSINVTKYNAWSEGEKENAVRLHVDELFVELKKMLDELKKFEQEAEADRKKEINDQKSIVRAYTAENKDKRRTIQGDVPSYTGGLVGDIRNRLDELVSIERDNFIKISAKTDEFNERTFELRQLLIENEMKVFERNEEVEVYRDRLKKLLAALAFDLKHENAMQEPDAKVIYAHLEDRIAYVSITAQDRVFPGMEFDVFGIFRGGVKKDKGRIRIVHIGNEYSKAIILSTNPANGEIGNGDFIWNRMYLGKKKNTFIFAGTFVGRLTKSEIISRLAAKGDIYHAQLKPSTLFIICGDGYEKDRVYKLREEFAVNTLRERDIYAYLGIEW